jgi:hypothetical protein
MGNDVTLWKLPAGYAKSPRKPGVKRAHPEQSLQTHVAELLGWLLPPEVPWTAIGHGGGGKQRGMILKGMGVHAGWPDLMLIYRGRPCFIELKATQGALSPAQKVVHTAITVAGGVVAVCRSIDQVRDILAVWGIPTRAEKPSATRLREAGERIGDGRQL